MIIINVESISKFGFGFLELAFSPPVSDEAELAGRGRTPRKAYREYRPLPHALMFGGAGGTYALDSSFFCCRCQQILGIVVRDSMLTAELSLSIETPRVILVYGKLFFRSVNPNYACLMINLTLI